MWIYHHVSVTTWSPAPELDSQRKGVEGSKRAELSGRPVPQAHLDGGGWLEVTRRLCARTSWRRGREPCCAWPRTEGQVEVLGLH